MQSQAITLPAMKLIGITCRTNNSQEMDPGRAKIGATVQHYFNENLAVKITDRKTPGITYCVYTDYESDMNGDYTYFIGEEVTCTNFIPDGWVALNIPAQVYTKFTTTPGVMPTVCIAAWQEIWTMTATELGGERAYLADFEVYDGRSRNPQNTILDIYISLKNTG